MKKDPYLAYLELLGSVKTLIGEHPPRNDFPPDKSAFAGAAGEKGNILFFAPHPDDEAIVGGLALRLLHSGYRVINVAVTLGSNLERRAGRLAELKDSCKCLGFDLVVAGDCGLTNVNVESRKSGEIVPWPEKVARIAEIITEYSPRAMFFPHANDHNTTHCGTHVLVADAIRKVLQAGPDANFNCFLTEYWHPMDPRDKTQTPNLLVENPNEDVARMMNAIALHQGEVTRNPYHLHLPDWLADNVRRGAETIGIQGGVAPDFSWGTIYRHEVWSRDGIFRLNNRFLGRDQEASEILKG